MRLSLPLTVLLPLNNALWMTSIMHYNWYYLQFTRWTRTKQKHTAALSNSWNDSVFQPVKNTWDQIHWTNKQGFIRGLTTCDDRVTDCVKHHCMAVLRFIRLEHNSFHMMQPAADTHSFTEPYGHIHSTNVGQVSTRRKTTVYLNTHK